MKYVSHFSILMSLVLSISSCGGGSGSSDNLPTASNRIDIGLDGAWQSGCYYDEDEEVYYIDLLEFDGNEVTVEANIWDNDTCSGVPIDSAFSEGTYDVGDLVVTGSGTDAYEIDFHMTYMGFNLTIIDLVEVHDGEFYLGEYIDEGIRPVEINYDIEYMKL